MTTKINVNKIVEAMKVVAKEAKSKPKTPFNPVVKPSHNVRDMRQEAIDMGSHGAKEYFGESK